MKNHSNSRFLLVISLLLLLGGCGGKPVHQKSKECFALFDASSLSVALECWGDPGSSIFETEKHLETGDLQELLSGIASVEAARDRQGWMITVDNPDSTKNTYYVQSLLYYYYSIHNMACSLVYQNETPDAPAPEAYFLLPFQFVPDNRLTAYPQPKLLCGAAYETNGTAEEFLAFYQNTGWYDAEKTENGLRINGYLVEPEHSRMQARLFRDFPVDITFSSRYGQNYFTLSVNPNAPKP